MPAADDRNPDLSNDDPLGQALRQPSVEGSDDSDVPVIVRLKSRMMSMATMSHDLRLAVLVTYGSLLIIILLIVFHNALGPKTQITEGELYYQVGAVAAAVPLFVVAVTLLLSGAIFANWLVRLGALLLLSVPPFLFIGFFTFMGFFIKGGMAHGLISRQTGIALLGGVLVGLIGLWVLAMRATRLRPQVVVIGCGVILAALNGFLWIMQWTALATWDPAFAVTILTAQLGVLALVLLPAFIVTGNDLAEWCGIVGARIGEIVSSHISEAALWGAAVGVAATAMAVVLWSPYRPRDLDLLWQLGTVVAGTLVIFKLLPATARRRGIAHPHVSYWAILGAAIVVLLAWVVSGLAEEASSPVTLNSPAPRGFSLEHPRDWRPLTLKASAREAFVALVNRAPTATWTFLVVGRERTLAEPQDLYALTYLLDVGAERVPLTLSSPDADGWQEMLGSITWSGRPGRFALWYRPQESRDRFSNTNWYLIGIAKAEHFSHDLPVFRTVRDSWSADPKLVPSAFRRMLGFHGVWLAIGAGAFLALALYPKRVSGVAFASLAFALILAIFMLVRNIPLAHSLTVPVDPGDHPVPLDLGAVNIVQLIVASGTIGILGWYGLNGMSSWLPSRTVRALLGVNLSLLFIRGLFEFYTYEGSVGERSNAVRAVFLLLALVWEIAVSGHSITNRDSPAAPRRARVLMFCGYILLVALLVFYFVPTQFGQRQIAAYDGESWAGEGILMLGIPWLFTVFAVHLGAVEHPLAASPRRAQIGRVPLPWLAGVIILAAAVAGIYVLQTRWADQAVFIDAPDAIETVANGVNEAGMIVGQYQDFNLATHGFRLSRTGISRLDYPNAVETRVNGINSASQVVGSYDDLDNKTHGFLLGGEGFRAVDVPGAKDTAGRGINALGQIVGFYEDAHGESHGYFLAGGHFTPLDFPGGHDTRAYGINKLGHVAGSYVDQTGRRRGFVLKDGHYTSIKVPSGEVTAVWAINDRGEILGTFTGREGREHGFLLGDHRFTTLDQPGYRLLPSGITNSGCIVGNYLDANDHDHGVMLKRPCR